MYDNMQLLPIIKYNFFAVGGAVAIDMLNVLQQFAC